MRIKNRLLVFLVKVGQIGLQKNSRPRKKINPFIEKNLHDSQSATSEPQPKKTKGIFLWHFHFELSVADPMMKTNFFSVKF